MLRAFVRITSRTRRDGRVVEGARLESVFRGNSNVGSNPTLSARIFAIGFEKGAVEIGPEIAERCVLTEDLEWP